MRAFQSHRSTGKRNTKMWVTKTNKKRDFEDLKDVKFLNHLKN